MTRFHILRTLITLVSMLAAIGCGDAGQAATDVGDTGILRVDPVAAIDLEMELALACQSTCDALSECGPPIGGSDCLDLCIASYSADLGEACTRAQINVLHCESAYGCTVSRLDQQCGEAVLEARVACRVAERGREVLEDSDGLVDETDEDAPADSGETGGESTDETEEDPTDIIDRIVIPEIPREIDPIDFPWTPTFDES